MNAAAKVIYLKPARLKATGEGGESGYWWKKEPRAPRQFTRKQIAGFVRGHQLMKLDAELQAYQALKNPFQL
jgi:hypothetical protein